ncbi:MAG: YbaB/EbfC family nucleoid-associated protein [Candidatus Doudnabacteria bacterium]|nr:YbaB/EbfC family nucleoid-associated protein [Candidatus Doudnabacteria bacterium]
MFDKLKDLYNLKRQAGELQRQLAAEKVTGLSVDGSFAVTLNGNHELLSVNISPDINLSQPEVQKNIKEAFNDAQKKLKTLLAERFQDML